MRKLATFTLLTLDGVMEAPGWSVDYWDETMEQMLGKSLAVPFDLLLGRKTYQVFAAHWSGEPDDPGAEQLNSARKYLATRTLTEPTWQNTTILGGDVACQVAELKAQDGPEIQVHGSWELIQTLLRADLIDEFRLWTFPVVAGQGKRLFGAGTPPAGLVLQDVSTSSTGVIMAEWTRSGRGAP